MANNRCHCQCCTSRGLMGPAVLITIGALFMLGQMGWWYGFGTTWPILLVVIGGVKLLEALASREGHTGS